MLLKFELSELWNPRFAACREFRKAEHKRHIQSQQTQDAELNIPPPIFAAREKYIWRLRILFYIGVIIWICLAGELSYIGSIITIPVILLGTVPSLFILKEKEERYK